MTLQGRGYVVKGQSESFGGVLKAGVTYSVFVDADESTADLDLRVFDENGHVIDTDVSPSADALCAVTPKWTGPFRFVVTAHKGASGYTISVRP